MAIDYIDVFKFLEENKTIIKEVIQSTIEINTVGKYVLNFFETFLRVAKTKYVGEEKCKYIFKRIRMV